MNLGDYLPGQLVIIGPGDSNLWAVNEGGFDGLAKEILRPTVEFGIPVINPANAYRLLHKRDDWHFSKHGSNPEILGQVCIHAINVSQADYVLQCMLHNLFNRAFSGAKPAGAESSGAGKLPTIERLVSPRADPPKGKVVSKSGEIGVDLDSDHDDEADKRHDSKLMELANAPIGLKESEVRVASEALQLEEKRIVETMKSARKELDSQEVPPCFARWAKENPKI